MSEKVEREFCSLCGEVVELQDKIPGIENGHQKCINHFLTYLKPPADIDPNIIKSEGIFNPLVTHNISVRIGSENRMIEPRGIGKIKINIDSMKGGGLVVVDLQMAVNYITWEKEEHSERSILNLIVL